MNSCNGRDFIPIPKGPHNKAVRNNAEGHAYNMRKNPSWLEKKMIELLDSWGIVYEFQKIFYMRSSGGFIKNYYIADFYIPKKKIILEVDGKFHKEQAAFDEFRTRDIQKEYPMVDVVRFSWKDVNDRDKMECFIRTLL